MKGNIECWGQTHFTFALLELLLRSLKISGGCAQHVQFLTTSLYE